MRVRYTVESLPFMGTGAFVPTPTLPPASSSFGLVKRTGAPGTEPQFAEGPTKTYLPPISADPQTQGSNVAPDFWLYDKYIAFADNMGPSNWFGMTFRRFTPLPIPAIHFTAVPRKALRSRKMAGRSQVEQPRAFQRFPNWTLTRSLNRG